MKRKLLLLLISLLPMLASAYDAKINGIYYNFSGGEATVTYQEYISDENGNGYYRSDYTDAVVIPASVYYNGTLFPVTSIGSCAFRNCYDLTSVTIGNKVTSIGRNAFTYCGLSTITIPESMTSIGDYAFAYCTGLTSVTIPNSVTSIGGRAFYACSSLTSITIPESVTSIGNYAFYACFSLTSVTIPNSVTSIGDYAFSNCYDLTSVTIPNSVTSIGSGAFYDTGWYDAQPNGILYIDNWLIGYKGTKPTGNVTINSRTRGIAGAAFSGCSDLTSVTIPNSVTSIGNYAFHGCSGLKSITIPNSVTSIGDYAFRVCSGLTSVIIPNSVTSIGESAFSGCSGLKSVTIGNSVTSIGTNAFSDCIGLTSVAIGNSVTSIGYGAFSGCSSLTSVTIPNSVTSIGDYAFSGCSGLTSITIPESVISIGTGAFSGTRWYNAQPDGILYIDNLLLGYKGTKPTGDVIINSGTRVIADYALFNCSDLTSVTIPNSVTSIGDYAFRGCSGLTSITIPESVTSIGDCAFWGCSGLTDVTIPNSVTSIGWGAFVYCSGLTSIKVEDENTKYDSRNDCNAIIETETNTLIAGCQNTIIPNSVTSIVAAFEGCTGLTSVTIPESVTSIGSNAFFDCSGLTSFTIPNSVTSIGNNAFYGCSGLTDVWCYAESVPITGSQVFYNSSISSATLHVPEGSVKAYRTTEPWSWFGNIVPIPSLAITFADANFKASCVANWDTNGDGELSKQEAAAVTDLGTAFKGNTTITYCNELQYFTGLTTIDNYAFYNCSNLTSITIPESVTSIGDRAFYGCI